MNYETRYIDKSNPKAMEAAEALLQEAGLGMDRHLDRTLGVFNEAGTLVATGSTFANTLRCLAVDSGCQGEGLLAKMVTRLTEDLFMEGITHLFVYANPESEEKLSQLGFYPIARVPGTLVFMENRRDGFTDYLNRLAEESEPNGTSGAVILNANPFTLGHRCLAETAAGQCDTLHVFVVSEDVSFFPFEARKRLVIAGTKDIRNIVYHDTGSYLISRAVFPAYFLKEEEKVTSAQAALDAAVFAREAKRLGLSLRFVGEEPFSPATSLYNQMMAGLLPKEGITLKVIRRLADLDGIPVSATRVRKALLAGDTDILRVLLPDTTLNYVLSEEGRDLVSRRLKEAE
ncbi:MAG: [citrate (pro-3S)-lyase] ligase [Eubacteriales bacterium]|nr:[citrate (pro-3S)-lyase] ligase [Eubacteriales bacterium]